MEQSVVKSPTPRWRYYLCGTLTLVALGVLVLAMYDIFSTEINLNDQIFVMQQFMPNGTSSHVPANSGNSALSRHDVRVPDDKPPTSPSSVRHNVSVPKRPPSISAWLQQRQALLSQKTRPTLVFLFAYMRGGSSIMGEMFNQDPHATMWYEPGDAFFAAYHGLHKENLPQTDLFFQNGTRRSLDKTELGALTAYYSKLLTCDLASLPPEALGHYFLGESTAMDGYMRCERTKHRRVTIDKCADPIGNICSQKSVPVSIGHQCHLAINQTQFIRKGNPTASRESLIKLVSASDEIPSELRRYASNFVDHELCRQTMAQDNAHCLDVAVKRCETSAVRVIQVNRVKMEDVEPLIALHPDIRVIHYTRDPRGIALSRSKTGLKGGRPTVTQQAKFLCDRMSEDLRQRRRLEDKYPGAFMTAKYEDMVVDPVKFANRIYSFWGSVGPKAWAAFAARTMHSKGSGFSFGITVNNAVQTANKWRTLLSKAQIADIESFCGQYLRDVGYPIIT